MPIISAKIIRPIKKRLCEGCYQPIEIGSPCLRLYGNAHHGDLKYAVYLHPKCTQDKNYKIVAAKKKMEEQNASV